MSTPAGSCDACGADLKGGFYCSDCQRVSSWSGVLFDWRFVLSRLLAVGLWPATAALVTLIYGHQVKTAELQRTRSEESRRSLAAFAELAVEVQQAMDALTGGCGKADYASCLAEYRSRIGAVDALVAKMSWKLGTMTVSKESKEEFTLWKNDYWESGSGYRRRLLDQFRSFRESGPSYSLVFCQTPEFETSPCGLQIKALSQPMRDRTTLVFCRFVSEGNHLRGDELTQEQRDVLEASTCEKLVTKLNAEGSARGSSKN